MEHTKFINDGNFPNNMMVQYRRDNETGKVSRIKLEYEYIWGYEYESGGAGLISTVEDCAHFAAAMANKGIAHTGERILSPATIDLMRLNQLNNQQMADLDWPHFVGYGYGLGVRTMIDPARGYDNSPVGEFGWGGAADSYLLIVPKNKISMFYAQHMRESVEPYVHPRLRNILYSCL